MVRLILCIVFLMFIFTGEPDIFDMVHSQAVKSLKEDIEKSNRKISNKI